MRAAAALGCLVLASAALGVWASLAHSAPAQPSPSRVLDRAFLCTNAARAGVRELTASAKSGFRDRGAWKWVASVGIGNSGARITKLRRGVTNTNWGVLVSAGAGRIARDPTVPRTEPQLMIWSRWARACRELSPSRVPLPARRLAGAVAGHFGDRFRCVAPRRVFVRVRAVFATPARLRLDRATLWSTARGPVREGFVVARTESGRLVAFATVADTDKARIAVAPSCFPE